MKRYTVTVTIQSLMEGAEPVDLKWYAGTSLPEAISALVKAAADDPDDSDLPEAVRYRNLSVRLDTEVLPDKHVHYVDAYGDPVPVETFAVDCDGGENCPDREQPEWNFETTAALDDCIYWSRPEADCAGPRVGYRADGVIVCEHHINKVPS